jgi:hypothetical protein
VLLALVCTIGLMCAGVGCASKSYDFTEARLLITIRVTIFHQGPTCTSLVRVNKDGVYQIQMWNPSIPTNPPNTHGGYLLPEVLAELTAFVKSTSLDRLDGSPVFDFCPENSYTKPPEIILKVFRTAKSAALSKEGTVDGGRP